MKIITLCEEDFDIYAKNHKMANIYQTSSYAHFMNLNGYDTTYLGFINNRNQIIGATLLVYKKIKFNYKIAYMPKGFLLNYNNYDNVKDISEKLKKLMYKQKFISFTIDPLIIMATRNFNGEVLNHNLDSVNIMSILEKCNYKHKGFNTEFEGDRPRFNAITYLDNTNEELYHKLNKQTRNKISKANKNGVLIYKTDISSLPILYEFIKRKSKLSLKYYENLCDSYKEDVEIYLAKIEPIKFVENAKKNYEKELKINENLNDKIQNKSTKGKDLRKILNKKMDSDKSLSLAQTNLVKATNMYQSKPDGIVIGGAIIIKQNKTKYLYIEGFNQRYRGYNPNYLLKWELIKRFNNEGYDEFNLNGVSGNFDNLGKYTGLNEMKSGFNSKIIEYIGEFDYVINPLVYGIYKLSKKL